MKTLIRQHDYCTGMPQAGHNKRPLYWGGEGGSESQSISGVTTIRLTQCNTSPLHRVGQVVDCGLWNVGPLLYNGCTKLLDIGRNWNTLWYMPIQSILNIATWGRALSCMQHEVMVVDEWHNNGPQYLVKVYLCIQNAINKMHLCSLSITFACPYHGPLDPRHWHQQTAHPHDATHAVCHLPCTVKTGIHPWREHLSKVLDGVEGEHLPTQVGCDDELQSGRDPDEDDEHADELSWDGFWQFVQKFFGYANRLLQQLSGWLVSDNLGGEACWIWRSWAGVVTRGLQLWGWLDVLPNSLKHL